MSKGPRYTDQFNGGGFVELVRADIGALARRAAKEMSDNAELERRKELSGQVSEAMQGNPPTLAVVERAEPPYPNDPTRMPCTSWSTMAQPYGIERQLVVVGNVREANLNGWTLRELLTRRMHRELRNAMVEVGVDAREAATVAKLSEIYVAEHSLLEGV